MLLGGMGPVEPDLVTTGGKLFAGFYALYAGMLVLVAASILLAPMFHRLFHTASTWKSRGRTRESDPSTRCTLLMSQEQWTAVDRYLNGLVIPVRRCA